MFPIHNCRPARMQPGRGVRALSLLSVGLLSLLPPQSVYPLPFLPPPPHLSPPPHPSHPLCARCIFHFNISIFMPHLRKFKVTVRRLTFSRLPADCVGPCLVDRRRVSGDAWSLLPSTGHWWQKARGEAWLRGLDQHCYNITISCYKSMCLF